MKTVVAYFKGDPMHFWKAYTLTLIGVVIALAILILLNSR